MVKTMCYIQEWYNSFLPVGVIFLESTSNGKQLLNIYPWGCFDICCAYISDQDSMTVMRINGNFSCFLFDFSLE